MNISKDILNFGRTVYSVLVAGGGLKADRKEGRALLPCVSKAHSAAAVGWSPSSPPTFGDISLICLQRMEPGPWSLLLSVLRGPVSIINSRNEPI